jgi:uncharacterized membrane protein YeiH
VISVAGIPDTFEKAEGGQDGRTFGEPRTRSCARPPTHASRWYREGAGRCRGAADLGGRSPLIDMEAANLLVGALDLIGTFMFATSGAMLGVRRGMDLFGVLVLAFVTAVFGGILRDLLIGTVPPAAVASSLYLAVAVTAGLLTFWCHGLLARLQQPVLFFDAVGLGIFAVAGTQKAIDYGLNWPMAAVLGMISGIGGVLRDVLAAQTPVVLQSDIYAVAALAGGLVVVAGSYLGLPTTLVTLAGAALCVFLRLMSLLRGWKLPSVKPNE